MTVKELELLKAIKAFREENLKGINANHKGLICLDMDGTIADLYNQPLWLEHILAEKVTPFRHAKPLVDTEFLNFILHLLRIKGYGICVISWLPPEASNLYKLEVSKVKLQWLKDNGIMVDEAFFLKKDVDKQNAIKHISNGKNCVIIDDDIKVLEKWQMGDTIDAHTDIIKNLIDYLTD